MLECPKCHKQVPYTTYTRESRYESCDECKEEKPTSLRKDIENLLSEYDIKNNREVAERILFYFKNKDINQ